MKAVNLIPVDARRGGSTDIRSLRGPGSAVVGLLGVVLVLVTLYVLASNSVADRQAKLTGLQQQLAQTQAEASKLNGYVQFTKLAAARVQTVKEIASGRFNWQQALSDLSRVVPANTSLSSLSATVDPSAGTGAGAGASGGSLRGDISAPAFELEGCTGTQDDVARLMSRLRLIRGVTRVTLSDAVKSSTTTTAAPVSGSSGGGCGPHSSTFSLVVFFQPLPTIAPPATGATGATGTAGTPAPTTPGSTQ